ncbi:MAG: PDZ domain-containing protein [Oscillospiraceae bacterium]|nr:PDZ domain-containing protein [Oscillospiraceae bacterium]
METHFDIEKLNRTPQKKSKLLRHAGLAALSLSLILGTGIAAGSALAYDLVPVGHVVGIHIETDGVMIAGIPDTCPDGKTKSPAKDAGFKVGDIIVKVGKAPVSSAKQLKDAISDASGGQISVTVVRGSLVSANVEGTSVPAFAGGANIVTVNSKDKNYVTLSVTPARLPDGTSSIGIMVRDSIAGIGTVTYYDPATKSFGALGHAVSDGETGAVFPLKTGEISSATVAKVTRGKSGAPGQLEGSYDFDKTIGSVDKNTNSGIFGQSLNDFDGKVYTVAEEHEIHEGKAQILSNVEGDSVEVYDIEIKKVFTENDGKYTDETDTRDFLIEVSDKKLIEKTGGIVQGMSGSPVLQDGKFIGAVTHVMINDPASGYGIAVDRMVNAAQREAAKK